MQNKRKLKKLYKRYVRNQCTEEELQRFFHLIRKLEDEKQIRALLSRTWDEWEQREQQEKQEKPPFRKKLLPVFSRNHWQKAAAVAAVIAGVVLCTLFFFNRSSGPVWQEQVAGYREQVQILLPDSSRVWLQPAGKIRYPETFEGDVREIFLEGKAVFNVKQKPRQPFCLRSGGLIIKVLGTEFDVEAYPADSTVRVTVISGKVQVEDRSGQLGVLSGSQQLSYHRARGTSRTATVDTAAYRAALQGEFRFREQELDRIVRELEHWYGVEFRFENEALKKCRYTARFDRGMELDGLLEILCEVNDLEYTIDRHQRRVRLAGPACPAR